MFRGAVKRFSRDGNDTHGRRPPIPAGAGLVLHSCRVSRPRRRFLKFPARAHTPRVPRRRGRDCAGPAACVGPRPGATPQPSAADVPAARKAGMPAPDVEALLGQMTLDEKIGQMTQTDKNALKDGREVHEFFMGSVLSGADSLPKPNDARHLGRHVRPVPEPGAVDAARDPDLLRRRRRPRRRRRQGLGPLPAQHRAGRHAQPGDRREGGARDGARGRRHRHALDVRPVHRRGARRALGAHLRELRRVARAGRAPGPGRRARVSGGAGGAAGTAILASAKHFLGDGGTFGGKDQGDTKISRGGAAPDPPPRLRRRVKAGAGSVMVSYSQLERGADARQQAIDHRRAQGRARLHRASWSATGRPSTRCRRTTTRTSRWRSTPASTW